ncbi:MAG: hypothetical protein JO198_12625 [Candidatus Dormibacteraeota bacterium]|nr:hypothetical protein [Candidatus Dormibacteraeota bacterium]
MSRIADIIQQYRAGKLTTDQLIDTLARYPFAVPTPVNDDPQVEDWDGRFSQPGTFDELDDLASAGLISRDILVRVLRQREALAKKGRNTPASTA